MSNTTYDELWRKTQAALEDAVNADTNFQSAKSQKDRKKFHKTVAELYVRYIIIANKIETCYDQILQPQKRLLLRKLLDSTLGRVLELKYELMEVDLCEHSYYDDILIKYKLTPQETEIRVPSYFRRERENEIQQRRKFIEDTLRTLGALDEVVPPKKMTESEAIRLIQTHERARQGRVRFQFMKEIREMKERSTIKPEPGEGHAAKEEAASIKIQKVWRGYITRYRIRKRRIEEMLLIGMVQPSQVITENAKQAERVKLYRHEKQKEFQDIYEQMVRDTTEFIRKERCAIMEENMRLEIRNWVNRVFQDTGVIPELPSAESGGSRIILSRQGTESSLSKSSKESKKSKQSKKSSDLSEGDDDPGLKSMPSTFLPEIIQANLEYDETWKEKDETMNPWQLPDREMLEAEKTREIEDEIRIGVDNAMRDDIETLQIALDRDKGVKTKRAQKPQKRRSGKKNKKKKEKDLTPDRTTESLFEELVTNGIIKLHPEVRITSFKGEKSYGNYDMWMQDIDRLPSLGDIRQAVTEFCIIPMGNETLRELTPLVRSVLLTGPDGSGKKMLIHAVCTELGATLFDLSPPNILGKYVGKSGQIMLMHLVSKVSRLLQPSIVFMDGGEKPFLKKVPKNDKTDPKRLKKDIPRLVRNITNEDRIMLISTSNAPWDADPKLLAQTYDRVLYVPRADYGTISLVWKDLVYKYAGINRQFDTSGMSKICDGFTVGRVIEAINAIMTTRRMVQLRVQPLTHAELVNALSIYDPVYREEEEAYMAWYTKAPMYRRKQRAQELEVKRLADELEKQKKKGKS